MITRPTVLVLGAGASQPYGFPLGSELRIDILRLADSRALRAGYEGAAEGAALAIRANLNLHPLFTEFVSAFKNSGFYSIDAFLVGSKVPECICFLQMRRVT